MQSRQFDASVVKEASDVPSRPSTATPLLPVVLQLEQPDMELLSEPGFFITGLGLTLTVKLFVTVGSGRICGAE